MGTKFNPNDFEYMEVRILRFPKKGYFDSFEVAEEFKRDLKKICQERNNVITINNENGFPMETAVITVMPDGHNGIFPYIKCVLYAKEMEESV